jgi:predicted amidophosphoribosyltransferase
MKCPSCSAEVEEGADLCLECGEPMGDSPVARAVRSEKSAPSIENVPIDHTEAETAPLPKIEPPKAAKRRRVEEEPEPKRCPGCGIPSTRERCPGCGTVLRRSED